MSVGFDNFVTKIVVLLNEPFPDDLELFKIQSAAISHVHFKLNIEPVLFSIDVVIDKLLELIETDVQIVVFIVLVEDIESSDFNKAVSRHLKNVN